MDVVAHLLSAVAEDGVGLAGHGAAHQIGEEPVELGACMVRARQAASTEADRGHVEVAAVLLHEQVGGGLGDAEQRVGRGVDRHRRVDPAVVAVVLGQLQAQRELHQRKVVGQVSIYLVRRAEDERRIRGMLASGLEQVERAVGVHAEVGLRVRSCPIMGGLRCGVDHEIHGAGPLGEDPRDAVGVPDIDLQRTELVADSGARARPSCERWTHRVRRTGRACCSQARSPRSRPRRNGRPTPSR